MTNTDAPKSAPRVIGPPKLATTRTVTDLELPPIAAEVTAQVGQTYPTDWVPLAELPPKVTQAQLDAQSVVRHEFFPMTDIAGDVLQRIDAGELSTMSVAAKVDERTFAQFDAETIVRDDPGPRGGPTTFGELVHEVQDRLRGALADQDRKLIDGLVGQAPQAALSTTGAGRGLAAGGVVPSGVAVLVGERGPEHLPTASRAGLLAPAWMRARPLVIIIPSKGRPGSVASTVKAWEETGAFETARLVYAVEWSELDLYRAALRDIGYESVGWTGGRPVGTKPGNVTLAPTGGALVESLNRTARIIAGLDGRTELDWSDVRAIGYQGDDHLPRTAGWAARYAMELDDLVDDFGAGLVYGDDALRGERLCTEWAVSRSWITALGRMVPALVRHMFCDNAMIDLARAAQICRYLGGGSDPVRIEHMHHLAEGADGQPKAKPDATYALGQASFQDDRRIYVRWSTRSPKADKLGLVRQTETLRALRPAPDAGDES